MAAVRVPDDVLKSVLFVGIRDANKRFLPKASAFFVKIEDQQYQWLYVVTAQHVIAGLLSRGHEIWIRNNRKDGGIEECKVPHDGWRFGVVGPDSLETDVAVCAIQVNPDVEDILAIGLNGDRSIAITADEIQKHDIGIGDEVTIVGLFRSHFGRRKNIPVVRIGHIAMLKGEPVWTKYGFIEAHLIEAMSINGLSGSPVFVNIGPARVKNAKTVFPNGKQFHLLGLMHGHFDVKNLNEDASSDDEKSALLGIHTGIGVVIPTSKILEVLFDPELIEIRRKGIEMHHQSVSTPNVINDVPRDDAASKVANPARR